MVRKIKSEDTPIQNGPMTAELLGKFIRAKRTQSGLRLNDAALLCGISIETLSKIETAKAGVNFNSVLKVAKMLGVQISVTPWEK